MKYTTKEFITKVAPLAQRQMQSSKILASLTIAQAILESSWGNSELTAKANNLFGVKGEYSGQSIIMTTAEYYNGTRTYIQAAFRKYPSWSESVADHTSFLVKNTRYANLIGETNYKQACIKIQTAGYATDPNYAAGLISLIEKYQLTQYDIKEEEEMVKTMTIELNGVLKQVQVIEKDGYNYIKLRDVADAKIIVDYDSTRKIPTVKVKADSK